MTTERPQHSRLLHGPGIAVVMISICVTASSCNRDAAPPSLVTGAPQSVSPAVAVPQEEQRRPAAYRSAGRRDPFQPSRSILAEKSLTVHLAVTGIIREGQSFYALVESDGSPGMGYVIRENDVVDSAKVVKITKDSVVFEVRARGSEGKLLTRHVEKHLPPVVSR